MYLENIVFDAADPRSLGRFWEAALGTEELTDEPEGYETRLAVPDGPVLDLCFQHAEPEGPSRLVLHLRAGGEPGTALVDPEGNGAWVIDELAARTGTGPIAALQLAVADPARDRDFWGWLTGWTPIDEGEVLALQHPSRRGPVIELVPEVEPKSFGKNRIHLDVRLEDGEDEDAVARAIEEHGGREWHADWGELPWRLYTDPSGNEFCVLPARS